MATHQPDPVLHPEVQQASFTGYTVGFVMSPRLWPSAAWRNCKIFRRPLRWLALRKGCRRYPAPDHVDAKGALAWGVAPAAPGALRSTIVDGT